MPSPVNVSFMLLLASFATGCASSDKWNATDYGVSAIQFQDMVVPSSMRIVDEYNESHSREAAGWRYGDFQFVGKIPVQEASAYLLQRMPEHNWQLVGEAKPDANTHNLQFERGRYRAKYQLERVDGTTKMSVQYRTETE